MPRKPALPANYFALTPAEKVVASLDAQIEEARADLARAIEKQRPQRILEVLQGNVNGLLRRREQYAAMHGLST